jgi:hypothetical protein
VGTIVVLMLVPNNREGNHLMNLKTICLGALALAMVSGTAFAGALDEPDNMAPFFTDSSMKTMKPMADFKTAFMAMPMEKQEAMK